MYCRYAKSSILDHKKCSLNGGKIYCVLSGAAEAVENWGGGADRAAL